MEPVFILLFVVAGIVAIAVKYIHIPYTAALVIAGILLGIVPHFHPPHLTKDLLLNIFLPGLLFEAAFHLEFSHFLENRFTVMSLALPGVAGAIALTALIFTPVVGAFGFAHGFQWQHALVFGALISATDPISVMAIFKSMGAPRRLSVLLESESLLNDGVAIVFFTLSLSLVAGATVTPGGLFMDFLRIVGIGGGIGAAIGLAASQVICKVDDPMIEITLTTVAAWGSFLAAEHFHFSGVIATVTAGMLCGNYAARVGMSPSTRIAVESFWEYITFALNSLVFLLIGLEVKFSALIDYLPAILAAWLVVTLGRFLIIGSVTAILSRTRERFSRSWGIVLTWGGLRGGLSMVLVLSLPPDFPHRDFLVPVTFGVVILSILGHGLTMTPLLRRLGIVKSSAGMEDYEMIRGRLQVSRAGLEEIRAMTAVRYAIQPVLKRLEEEYVGRIETEMAAMDLLLKNDAALMEAERRWVSRHLQLKEKDQVIQAFRNGEIGQKAHEHLLADIDARLIALAEEPH